MIGSFAGRRRFKDLSEQEILALAISSEEDDGRIYQSYAEHVRKDFPATAEMLDGMAAEENHHRQRLIDLHKRRFGEVIPLIRREHVAGFYARNPIWLVQNLGIDRIRDEITGMERNAHNFYTRAAQRATDADSTFECAATQAPMQRWGVSPVVLVPAASAVATTSQASASIRADSSCIRMAHSPSSSADKQLSGTSAASVRALSRSSRRPCPLSSTTPPLVTLGG